MSLHSDYERQSQLGRGVADFGELARSSHNSKMVLPTVNLGPPKKIRTCLQDGRQVRSLAYQVSMDGGKVVSSAAHWHLFDPNGVQIGHP